MVSQSYLSAHNAAVSFARRSDHSKEQEILAAGLELMRLDNHNVSRPRECFDSFAKELLEIGRIEQYKNFSEWRRHDVINARLRRYSVETLFLINDVKRGVLFLRFNENKDLSFKEFDTELSHQFGSSFRDLGTDDFRKSLHHYFNRFGSIQYRDKHGLVWTEPGESDDFITLSAFVMRQTHGEEKVIALLDRIVAEDTPIRAHDFIKLIKSFRKYSDYPVSWAVTLV